MEWDSVRYKLFISDVVEMRKQTDGYFLNNLRVIDVDLIGNVVYKAEVQDKWIFYKVDDGTAVIDCVYSCPEQSNFPRPRSELKEGSKALLRHLDRIDLSHKKISIGSTVQVLGYIKEFKGRRTIFIKSLRHVTDRNEQIYRDLVTEALYEDVYGITENRIQS